MSELNLPTLNLFNKTPLKSHRYTESKPSRQHSPLKDILRQTNRIDEQIYTPYLPYRPTIYDQEYLQVRDAIKLEYLNAYSETLRKAEANINYPLQKGQYDHSHGGMPLKKPQPLPCDCHYQQGFSVDKAKPIVKTPYISNQYVPSAPFKNADSDKNAKMPSKDVYLEGKKPLKEEPDVSIIQKINKSLLETEKNQYPTNLSKMINDSNYMNTNQSIIMEVPQPPPPPPPPKPQIKKALVSQQVQTEEMGNKSIIFIDQKKQKMDHNNFQKTIKDLNAQITNLNLDLSNEDIIIDLGDLIQTKKEYFEESKEILSALEALTDEDSSNRIMIRSRKAGQMIWPQF